MFDLHGFPDRLLRLPALVLLQNCAKSARPGKPPAWAFFVEKPACSPRGRAHHWVGAQGGKNL